jgi:uncharacterized protein (DUF305 family)
MTSSSSKPAARTFAAAAALAVASTLLSSCGSGGDGASSDHAHHAHGAHKGTARHNAADVSFARRMIPHHRQAVEMAELADERAGSRQVRTLAVKIEKAQGPEITRMSGWLEAWGQRAPASGSASGRGQHGQYGQHHGQHGQGAHQEGHGGQGMSGMMDEREMNGLKAARGKDFDEKFLTMMVGHHEGAVEMARTERSQGRYEPAKKLASAVVSAQSAEIRDMRALRKRLRG